MPQMITIYPIAMFKIAATDKHCYIRPVYIQIDFDKNNPLASTRVVPANHTIFSGFIAQPMMSDLCPSYSVGNNRAPPQAPPSEYRICCKHSYFCRLKSAWPLLFAKLGNIADLFAIT